MDREDFRVIVAGSRTFNDPRTISNMITVINDVNYRISVDVWTKLHKLVRRVYRGIEDSVEDRVEDQIEVLAPVPNIDDIKENL